MKGTQATCPLCRFQVEALAHCYGFLLANGSLQWAEVEAALGRPYTFSYFWRVAPNSYRYIAVAMVAIIAQVTWEERYVLHGGCFCPMQCVSIKRSYCNLGDGKLPIMHDRMP